MVYTERDRRTDLRSRVPHVCIYMAGGPFVRQSQFSIMAPPVNPMGSSVERAPGPKGPWAQGPLCPLGHCAYGPLGPMGPLAYGPLGPRALGSNWAPRPLGSWGMGGGGGGGQGEGGEGRGAGAEGKSTC